MQTIDASIAIGSLWVANAESTGKIAITKVDGAHPDTKLAGAVFGIYSDAQCTQSVGEITTTKNGGDQSDALKIGTYYVKEKTAPQGYCNIDTVYTAVVTKDGVTTIGDACRWPDL